MLISHPKCSVSSLSWNSSNQNFYRYLNDILGFNISIKSLKILEFKYNRENAIKIQFALTKNLPLKKIHVESERFLGDIPSKEECDSFQILINSFNNNSSCDELTFRNLTIDKNRSLAISNFIKENKTIKKFVLERCFNLDRKYLFKDSLQHNNCLESLGLERNHFYDKFYLKNLLEELALNKVGNISNLKHISLNTSLLGKKEFQIVTQIISANQNITSLDLNDSYIGKVSLPLIIFMIKNNKSLKSLKMHNSSIGDNGFLGILEALSQNNTLECVDLSNNKFYCKKEHISELLQVNHSLKDFILEGNKVSSEAKEILECFKKIKGINI